MSTALLRQFLAESRELIQQASDDLLALERNPGDAPRREAVFRAFHTLKGSAALFDLAPLTTMLHAAEDLLAALRDGVVAEQGAVAELALDALDQAARWLDVFEAEGRLPPGAAGEADALIARFRELAGPAMPEAPPAADAPPDWIATLTTAERAALRGLPREPGAVLLALTYDPDPDCFFRGEDPLAQMQRVPGMAVCRLEPRMPWPSLAEMDPFRCDLRLRALALVTSAQAAELRAAFRLLGPQMRLAELPPELLLPEPPFPARPVGGRAAFAQAVLVEQRRVLAMPAASAEGAAGRVAAAARAAANALRSTGQAGAAGAIEAACAADPGGRDAQRVDRAIAEAQHSAPARPAPDIAGGGGARLLRVDPAKVDRLVALADEMVLARNALQHLLRRAEQELGAGRDLVKGLKDQHATLERLAREWHEAAVRMRMVPVEEVFRRFPRLVRELSRQLGKNVELVLEGERTEADRDLVEALSEPLLHLLRNSVDHGIEAPEERRRAGKPDPARLILRASQEGDRIVIEVEDDGRGVDAEELRRSAVRRGAIEAERAAALTETEVLELAFAAGVSTAGAVSDISGRGVGMDTVRVAAERAGGAVSIRSRRGEGTIIRLSLPLAVTLTQILTIGLDGHEFGLPLDAVVESLRVPASQVRNLRDGAEAFALEDRVLPLVSLRRILDLPEPARERAGGERRIVVVQAEGQEAGLEVDEVGERLEVILRPLSGLLAGMPGYLGTTLLGSGRVTLVLDVREALR